MSDPITIRVDVSRAREAFKRAPEAMERNIERFLSRGAIEVADAAKDRAPKLFSTLANSINFTRITPLHYQVAPGMNYGRMVEEGSGPAVGKERYFPNVASLYQYLEQRPSMRRFEWGKLGSKGRDAQYLELNYRARAWAWHIYNHGTRPQPFMRPAAEANRSRLFELIGQGVDEGLKEAFRV